MARYSYYRDVKAGCHDCNGYTAMWTAKNAQGVAAKHAEKHKHNTWVEIDMCITYKGKPKEENTDAKIQMP